LHVVFGPCFWFCAFRAVCRSIFLALCFLAQEFVEALNAPPPGVSTGATVGESEAADKSDTVEITPLVEALINKRVCVG
jgi:hypothetical protein